MLIYVNFHLPCICPCIAHSVLWDSPAILCFWPVLAILNNIVLSEKHCHFFLSFPCQIIFEYVEQTNHSCRSLWDMTNDLCSFKKWAFFFPRLLFMKLFSLVLSALLIPEQLSFFKAWGTLSTVFWKFQVMVSTRLLIPSGKSNDLQDTTCVFKSC